MKLSYISLSIALAVLGPLSGGVEAVPSKYRPYGIKAGITGEAALAPLQAYISSYSNWRPDTYSSVHPAQALFMPMLWGSGTTSQQDANRVATFRQLFGANGTALRINLPPRVVLGFEEPDCATGNGSSGVGITQAAQLWNQLIAPLKKLGTVLVSPSMCKQRAETWLTPFESQINTTWDITNVHINSDNITNVKLNIDYFANKYQRPIYITEFACVSTKPVWAPCTNQTIINTFIRDVVPYFESDDRIAAYQFSQGMGLAPAWNLMNNGTLSETGRAYFAAIKPYAVNRTPSLGF